jgi:hypothetical protein
MLLLPIYEYVPLLSSSLCLAGDKMMERADEIESTSCCEISFGKGCT